MVLMDMPTGTRSLDGGRQVVFRVADEQDIPACLQLDHSSTSDYVWQVEAREEQGAITYSFRTVRLPRSMPIIAPHDSELMTAAVQAGECLLVAEAEGRVVAYLLMRPDHACGIGWIHTLVVDRPLRRQRLGSALLREAQGWARARNLTRITVETQTKNHPAIAFCQRQGLRLCGFNDRYYPNQDIALFFTQSLR